MLTSAPLTVDPSVPVVARALRARDVLADLQVVYVCGEPDVRLVACRDGGDVTVELLATLAAERPADRWQAVRVRGDDRQVWQGPPHDAAPAEVVGFVEALLAVQAQHLPFPCIG